MSATVASLAPHLRASFWNDWGLWLLPPLDRQRWVVVHDNVRYKSPLEASAPPWSRHRRQGCAAEDDLVEYQMAAEQPLSEEELILVQTLLTDCLDCWDVIGDNKSLVPPTCPPVLGVRPTLRPGT
eukprot:11534724-Heterocapsa_arctica.AAC.1